MDKTLNEIVRDKRWDADWLFEAVKYSNGTYRWWIYDRHLRLYVTTSGHITPEAAALAVLEQGEWYGPLTPPEREGE